MREALARLPAWAHALIALSGSVMLGLGAPPGGLTLLIWLSFVPLVVVMRVSPPGPIRRPLWLGLVGGLGVGLVGFPWVAELLGRFAMAPAWVSALGQLGFSLWTAVPFAIWAVLVVNGPHRGAAAVAWPVVVYLAVAAAWPDLFPYTGMIGLAETPAWIQLAEWGGVPLVEAQVVLTGVLLADAIVAGADGAWPSRRRIIAAAVALAIPIVSWVYGQAALARVDREQAEARKVRFGVVQPNNPLTTVSVRDRMARLRRMSALAQLEGAQLVVWPEAGAYPFVIPRPFTHDFHSGSMRVIDGFSLPVIFGAGTYGTGEKYERNSVFHMAADGTVQGRFDKNILVPFGEYIPIVDPAWAQSKIPSMSHNIAGEGPARFLVQPAATASQPDPGEPVAIGPLVCYEDIFADFAHDVARQEGGVDAFVNVTIDTWFGDTAEPWEHLALAQFRCVEHRIPMVRSVAAGVSATIDAGGRLTGHLDVTAPEVGTPLDSERLVRDVALPRNTAQSPTIFASIGWLLPWLCGVVVLFGLAVGIVRRRRGKGAALAGSGPADL